MAFIRCAWHVKCIYVCVSNEDQLVDNGADQEQSKCRPDVYHAADQARDQAIFGLVCSVIYTWSSPGLRLSPPIGLYVACVYSS